MLIQLGIWLLMHVANLTLPGLKISSLTLQFLILQKCTLSDYTQCLIVKTRFLSCFQLLVGEIYSHGKGHVPIAT